MTMSLLLMFLSGCCQCDPCPLCCGLAVEPLWDVGTFEPEVAIPVSVASGDSLGEIVPVGDLDGDGTDDLVISLGAERLGVFRGADLASGAVETTADAWEEVDAERAARAGDVDGDGLADRLVGGPLAWTLSPSSGDSTRELVPPEGRTLWGAVGGGDVDGDGLDDVLVSERDVRSADRDLEDLRLYLGSDLAEPGDPDPLDHPSSYWTVVDGDTHYSMTLDGDYDGDGLADLATGAVRNFGAVTGAETLLERDTQMLSDHEVHLHDCHPGDETCPHGVWVRPAGDADGDGTDDLLLVGFHTGGTWYVPGADLIRGLYISEMTGRTPVVRVELRGATSAVGVGDLDGDGDAEVLASDGRRAWLMVGPQCACEQVDEEGESLGADITTALHRFEGFADADLEVVAPGDLDGDGTPDLLLVDPTGTLHVVLTAALEAAR